MSKIPKPKTDLLHPDQYHRLLIIQRELNEPGKNSPWETGVRMLVGRLEKETNKSVRLAFLSWAFDREIASITNLTKNEKYNINQWAKPHANPASIRDADAPKWLFADTLERDITIIKHAFLGVQLDIFEAHEDFTLKGQIRCKCTITNSDNRG